ncbi:transposase [Paracerasibacillus soli]|uniref:Transposase n=1 Tax=Paracerasibacillus soli TaxID=480284 RepID=A0ABU5CV72_9BACI|nr:transposase [Virgibacillus soli]MDY0410278.1 transposase [Virgibacillus soli]
MVKKYSDSLKLKVVKEYQEGSLGVRRLAKKHGIQSKSQVDRWIKLYEKYGVEGLKSKKHNETYSVQLKLDVLKFIERTGSSEMETALHFGLKNTTIISSWKKAFREGGAGALNGSKGWSTMPDTSKKNKTKKEKKMK